ncbi:hypothetical protein GCM10020254_40660 [Streptomyces goshikiensis]
MVRSPARAARMARAQASVEAPAPPLPPITPHGEGRLPGAFHHIGDAVDEPALGVGEPQHLLGADLHRPLPHQGIVQLPADEEHAVPAGRTADPPGGVVPDEHERRGLPADSPAHLFGTSRTAGTAGTALPGHRVAHMRLGARGGTEPQQVIQQQGVLGDDQRPPARRPGADRTGRPPASTDEHALRCFTRLRSSHDLRPLLTANPKAADFAAGITVTGSGKKEVDLARKTVDNPAVVNNFATRSGEFQSAPEQLRSVTRLTG